MGAYTVIQDPNKKTVKPPPGFVEDVPPPPGFVMDSGVNPVGQPQERPLYRRINAAATQPLQTAGQGVEQIGRGNYAAGIPNVMSGALSAPFAPIGVANEMLKEVPVVGKPLSNALETAGSIPPWLFGVVGEGVQGGLNAIGFTPEKERQILGQTPAQYQETQQAAKNISDVGSYYAIPALKESLGPALKAGAEKVSKAREGGQIATAQQEIKSVAPPTSKQLNYDETLKRATPYIAQEQRISPIAKRGEVSPMRQASDMVSNAAQKLWNDKVLAQIDRHPEAVVDETPAGQAILSTITDNMRRHEPEKAAKVEAFANTFNQSVPIKDVHDLISEINARGQKFYKASPEGQAQMLTNDPMLEAKISAADALREQLFNTLDAYGEKGTAELRKDYGALSTIKQAIDRKIVSAEKKGGVSGYLGRFSSPAGVALATEGLTIGAMHHPGTAGLALAAGALRDYFIEKGKPNPTIARAFGRLGKTSLNPRNVPEPPDITNTPSAESFGATLSHEQAKNLWKQFGPIEENAKKVKDKKIGYQAQLVRERVEGFIANQEGWDWRTKTLTPAQIDEWFRTHEAKK